MSKMGDLTQRIIIHGISLIIIILLITFIYDSYFRIFFTAVVALVQAVALWEYFRILKHKQLQPAISLGITASVAYVFASFLKTQFTGIWEIIPEIVLAITFFAFFVFYAFWRDQPTINISSSFLGIIYVTIPMALIIRIVYFHRNDVWEGRMWLIYLIAVTKAADTAAYFVGRFLGRIKLAARLSPNKTLEGALGGLLASILVSFILYLIGKEFKIFTSFSFWEALTLGGIIGIAGQLGDLAESLLKRDAKIKDSNCIPGIGGVLDVIDSLLFTSPIIYIFLKFHMVQNS